MPPEGDDHFLACHGAQLGATLEGLVKDFNATHPDIIVRLRISGQLRSSPAEAYRRLVAQKPPTVSQVYGNWAAEFITSNALVPIENFKRSQRNVETEVDDIYEGLRKASMINGKWYTMPFNKSVYVLVYNRRPSMRPAYRHLRQRRIF